MIYLIKNNNFCTIIYKRLDSERLETNLQVKWEFVQKSVL